MCEALKMKAAHAQGLRAVDEFVAAFEAEHGHITENEMREAARRSRGRAVVVRGSAAVGSRRHTVAMASWKELEGAEPDFAARVRSLFDAGRHKTIATLRADGSPRISGIECEFADGELKFGSMSGARKGADLKRDPRFALHGPTFHPVEGKESEWPGEAKISGKAVLAGPISDGPDGGLFLADISEVAITRLNPEATMLVIESWTPQRGLRVVERE
ncbi:MAG TPA: pyridoxamine 5'-phosphate oxidase family protein [Streptosporangiaceae bacterium]